MYFHRRRKDPYNSNKPLNFPFDMKKITFFCLLCLFTLTSFAQVNMSLQSTVTYGSLRLNDVWGYEAGGSEYALVGTRQGVNILDVSNPAMPVDLGTATGPTTVWRDIKTWGNYAYVINEEEDGLLVIDLSGLPTPITSSDWYYWEPNIPDLGGVLSTCHNIWIDENGYGYLAGCDRNSGGVIYIDLFTNAATDGMPIYVDKGPAVYAHDVYVDNNIMYTSEVYAGDFSIFNVANKAATTQIGLSQETPYAFTHNAWPNGAGDVLFTTDEKSNASVAAYDISDPNDIQLLDEFRPLATINTGVLPHNVHVINDYLVISHYSDGVVIVDASVPENMIEVGNYDTGSSGSGCWGAYPYLSSGTILTTDINNGFAALTPTYVRAARLHGKITDFSSGANLNGAKVDIDVAQANVDLSDFNGDYKTGIVSSGVFNVTVSLADYFTQVIPATFTNGVITTLNVQLVPISVAIELFGFEAKQDANGAINLDWQVASDDPFISFDIERSLDGVRFTSIDFQEDNSPTLYPKKYQYVDKDAPAGKLYYRIRMIEPSGEYSYSPVRSIDHSTADQALIRLYPNPIRSNDFLQLEADNLGRGAVTLEVYNGLGVLVDQVQLEKNTQQWTYSTANLARGLYYMKFSNEDRLLQMERLNIID